MSTTKRWMPVLLVALILGMAGSATACPNCKEAVANQEGENGEGLRNGYGWSIIMMISTPFSLLSAGAFMVARAVKRGSLPEL